MPMQAGDPGEEPAPAPAGQDSLPRERVSEFA